MIRATIGPALRRALRKRDPLIRAAAMANIVRNLETSVRALGRRLKKGLTRRDPIAPAHCADPLTALFRAAPGPADTA